MDVTDFFVQSWPWKDSSRCVLFLRQVECILFILPGDYQKMLFGKVFPNIRASLASLNRFVSLQALQMVARVVQQGMHILDSKVRIEGNETVMYSQSKSFPKH